MKKKKKRRLRQPFRFIRNVFYTFVIILILCVITYKLFVEKELDALVDTYNAMVLDEKSSNFSVNVLQDSFTIAFIGYDELEGIRHADSINIAFINPKINEVKIINVPRDSYINYYCIDDSYDKITNAMAFGGVDCVIDGLENLIEREIDFYISSNFYGLVGVIDSIGGINTNVPDFMDGQQWCEQDSSRTSTICFEKFGNQSVSGEQALAIARSRKYSSDLDRGNLQSQIINDTLKTIFELKDTNKMQDILISVEGNVLTNITAKQASQIVYITYMGKRENNSVERIQFEGVAEYGMGERGGWGSYFFIDEDTRIQVISTMDKFMDQTKTKSFWLRQFENLVLE